jgi:hypothetical protein
MSTPTPLSRGELPLVLLAAVAHPTDEFREDLARRLRAAIAALKPAHDTQKLRAFFVRQDRRRRCGLRLSPLLRQLSGLVAQIAFAANTHQPRQRMLIAPGAGDLKEGVLVTRELEVISLRRSALTRHRIQRRQEDCRFLPDLARKRLDRRPGLACGVSARCRVENRLVIELTDEAPWPGNVLSLRAGNVPERTPEAMGFVQERIGTALRMWPESPEATLRFTAWLAEGRTLTLEHGYAGPSRDRRRIVVRLRDFDGDEAQLSVIAANNNKTEPWLVGVPEVSLSLTADDHAALSKWAYPLAKWLTDSLVEKLS